MFRTAPASSPPATMRPSTFLLLALSTVTFAQPTLRPRDNENNDDNKNNKDKYDWAPALERYYQAVGKHVAEIRTAKDVSNILSTCDLTQAVQPVAPSPLPAPAAGLSLAHVALGRGTQVSDTLCLCALTEHQLTFIRITLARERHRRMHRRSSAPQHRYTMHPAYPRRTRTS